MVSKIGKILILFDHLKMEIPFNFLMNAPPQITRYVCVHSHMSSLTQTHTLTNTHTLQTTSEWPLWKRLWDSISDFFLTHFPKIL